MKKIFWRKYSLSFLAGITLSVYSIRHVVGLYPDEANFYRGIFLCVFIHFLALAGVTIIWGGFGKSRIIYMPSSNLTRIIYNKPRPVIGGLFTGMVLSAAIFLIGAMIYCVIA